MEVMALESTMSTTKPVDARLRRPRRLLRLQRRPVRAEAGPLLGSARERAKREREPLRARTKEENENEE